nr:MAG: DNA pilot protein [Microvirus sp.]
MGRKERKFQAQQAELNRNFQSAEAQKNRDFEVDMWNKTNEYNSATNQRARLEEAGLNPYMMMNGGNAGEAGSVTAPSTPQGAMPSATGDTTGNVISGLNSVSNAIGQFYDNMLTQSRATAQNYENFFNDPSSYGKDQWQAMIMKMLSPDSDNSSFLSKDSASRVFGKYGNWKQAGSAVIFDNAVQSSDLDRQNKNLTNQMIQANMIQVNLSSDAQKIINKYLDQQESVKLNIQSALYTETAARGQLTFEQWQGQLIQNMSDKLDYRTRKAIADEFIRASCEAYKLQYFQSHGALTADVLTDDGKKTGKKYYQESMKLDLLNKRFMGNSLNRNYQWLDFTQGAGNLLQGFGSAAQGLKNINDIYKKIPELKLKTRTTTEKFDAEGNYTGAIIQRNDFK